MARRLAQTRTRSRRVFRAFGYGFTHLPSEFREELSSLEREGAIYTDHWIDELADFRHVRIPFTQDEATDYARRLCAYDLYLRTGKPEWAHDVPGIDSDIAQYADTYSIKQHDGSRIGPPYLCVAAFMGSRLESIVCGSERRIVIELQGKASALFTLGRAVRALTPTIRSFNTREKGLNAWKITREDDVRDLLYVMLKPILFDLVKEEPTPSLVGLHKLVELVNLEILGQTGLAPRRNNI